jgi:signal transduction histidine kinase
MRLRTRMIIIALAAAAGALLVVLVVAGPRLRQRSLEAARATLFAEARLMARLVRPPLAAGVPSDELDRLVDAAAGDVRARVTIIAPDGKVLADAELSGAALAAVENHANRPEIIEAREKGVGSSLRRSTTVNRDLLYGAVTIEQDGRLLGFSRVAEVEFARVSQAFALTAVPFPGEAGAPHGAVLTFHDVTSRRRLEEIRRDFVANASHELRTPLTSIRGFVEALEDGALGQPDTAERFLRKIRTHADRMTALLSDLLDLSRLESGQNPPIWEPVHVEEAAEDVLASFASLARSSRVKLRHMDLGAPMVVSDIDRVRRILEVLVDNAIKYTAARHADGRGEVEVVSGPGGDGGARLEVADNGPGIAAEHLPRVFERFHRVDKARSRELGGTGLGLSIARHLAEGMGASLTATSAPGSGTRFVLDVPARPDTETLPS